MNADENREFNKIIAKVRVELGTEIAKGLQAKLRPAIQGAPADLAGAIQQCARDIIDDAVPMYAMPSFARLSDFVARVNVKP